MSKMTISQLAETSVFESHKGKVMKITTKFSILILSFLSIQAQSGEGSSQDSQLSRLELPEVPIAVIFPHSAFQQPVSWVSPEDTVEQLSQDNSHEVSTTIAPYQLGQVQSPAIIRDGHMPLGELPVARTSNKGYIPSAPPPKVTGIIYPNSNSSQLPHIPAEQSPLPPNAMNPAIEIIRDYSDGRFHVNGQINRVPVRCVIDTGASVVSVPARFSHSLGLTHCDYVGEGRTANGNTKVCIIRNNQLAIGPFLLNGTEVHVLPNLDNCLIGMNVISKFEVLQKGDRMTIKAK